MDSIYNTKLIMFVGAKGISYIIISRLALFTSLGVVYFFMLAKDVYIIIYLFHLGSQDSLISSIWTKCKKCTPLHSDAK